MFLAYPYVFLFVFLSCSPFSSTTTPVTVPDTFNSFNSPLTPLIPLPEIQDAIDLRQDGTASAWSYQCSHAWFELRITSATLAGNFHLKCGACIHCTFDTHWKQPRIHIQRATEGAGYLWVVKDNDHLLIHCNIIVGNYNVQPVFQ